MKKKSVKARKKEADRVCSLYIRIRDRDVIGDTVCFTCGKKSDMKKMQCGHFIPRQYLAVRYDERNLAAQCYACNMLYNGQPSVFALRLIDKYGQTIIKDLELLRKKTSIDFDYESIISHYTQKLDNLGLSYLI